MTKYKYNENIDYFEIDPLYLSESLDEIKRKNYVQIRIKCLDLNIKDRCDLDFTFLESSPIKKLIISNDFKIGKLLNIDCLYNNKSLKHLEIENKFPLDFEYLTQLETLYIKYTNKLKNINCLKNLNDLLLSSFNEVDCEIISELQLLKRLRLSGSFISLKGLDTLINLNTLNISHCPKLENIEVISSLTQLEKLHIEKCKLLSNFSVLKESNVTDLFISELDSLDFITEMKSLKKINFWNCKDGNLKYILDNNNLETVCFYPNKKSYTHTLEEIEKIKSIMKKKEKGK